MSEYTQKINNQIKIIKKFKLTIRFDGEGSGVWKKRKEKKNLKSNRTLKKRIPSSGI